MNDMKLQIRKKKIQIDSKKQIDTYIQYIHIDTLSITSLI